MTHIAGGPLSNTRHASGTRLIAPGLPSPEQNPVNALGQSVAYHLAAVLGDLVQRATALPECLPCTVAAKVQISAYQVRCKNAMDAGEDAPGLPEPPRVARSVTVQDGRPVCFDHVEAG